MKSKFSGYYRPSKVQFQEIWGKCTFVFDTSVLRDLYSYQTNTVDEIINILKKFSDRIWLPYQVALEFHTGRIGEIDNQKEIYNKTIKSVRSIKNDLTSKQHPFIDEFEDLIKNIEKIEDSLNSKKEEFKKLYNEDPILKSITELFDGKVGPKFEKDMSEIKKIAGKRKDVPPGYLDFGKEKNPYGDLIIWFQIIEKAKESKAPIIFVTNDSKADWWLKNRSQETLGPRPELIQEMKEGTEQSFYMYSFQNFMERATKYCKMAISNEAIQEMKDHEAQKEKQSQIIRELAQRIKAINKRKDFNQIDLPDLNDLAETWSLTRSLEDIAGEIPREALQLNYIDDIIQEVNRIDTSKYFSELKDAAKTAQESSYFDIYKRLKRAGLIITEKDTSNNQKNDPDKSDPENSDEE